MSQTAIAKSKSQIAIGNCKVTPTRLEIEKDVTFEQWNDIFNQLRSIEGAVQWWVGDCINHGEKTFGDKYSQALESTDYALSSLQQYAWVSSSVKPSIRSDKLSFCHHLEVAKLPPNEQGRWLNLAEDNSLSVRSLRYSIKHDKVLSEEELDEMSGRGSGIKGTIETIMHDFDQWHKREFSNKTLSQMTSEQVAALESELRPVGELWSQARKLIDPSV